MVDEKVLSYVPVQDAKAGIEAFRRICVRSYEFSPTPGNLEPETAIVYDNPSLLTDEEVAEALPESLKPLEKAVGR